MWHRSTVHAQFSALLLDIGISRKRGMMDAWASTSISGGSHFPKAARTALGKEGEKTEKRKAK
jgi:hypothetical protein